MSKHNADSKPSVSMDRDALYQLVKRSDMNVAEVERQDRAVVELSVLWQSSILRVAHLDGAQGFTVSCDGEDREDRMVIDESMMPEGARELSLVSREGGSVFVFARGGRGEVEKDGKKLSLEQAAEQGLATARADGALEVALREGVRCKLTLGGLTVSARVVAAARQVAGRTRKDPALLASALGAFLMVGSMVAAGHLTRTPEGSLVSDSQEDRLADIMGLLNRARERAPEAQPQPESPTTEPSAQGAAARGDEGQSGRRDSAATNRRMAVRDRGVEPQLARPQNAREQVASRGIFAALGGPAAMTAGSAAPVSPWGGLVASGHDSSDAWGNHAGDTIGDAFGYNGLGNVGTGVGQGGNGEGTVCTGDCGFSTRGVGGSPDGDRYGVMQGQRLGTRRTGGPILRAPAPTVTGEYSRELVRRVVLRNLGAVTRCHEQGLAQNPDLQGRVVVTFMIAPQGNVLGSSVRESNVSVPGVADCIARAVRTWQFTAPQSMVTVHYPFMLERAL